MTRLRVQFVRHFAEVLLWVLAACAVYFTDVARFSTSISQGTEGVATVPLFNLWTIEWNIHCLEHGFSNYWNAPIFAPQQGSFAFSEPQSHTVLLAPIAWATNSVVAYNVLFLIYLALNGWCTRRLLRAMNVPRLWSIAGGVMLLLLPFLSWQCGVLQWTAWWGPMRVDWCFVRVQQHPDWKRSILLGVAFALSYLACNYYALFLSLLAPCFLVLAGWKLFSAAFWKSIGLGAVTSLLLLGPMVFGQWTNLKRIEADRSLLLVSNLSAHPRDYFTNRDVRLPLLDSKPWADPARSGWYLGTGTVLLGLALLGTLGGCWTSGRRRWTLFCLCLGAMAFVASCGPMFRWGPLAPYHWLMGWYPGLNTIRSPFRFAVFVQWSVALLAVEGLWSLQRWGAYWFLPPVPVESDVFVEQCEPIPIWQRWAGVGLSLAFPMIASVLVLLQIWPARLVLVAVPQRTPQAGWIVWLREHTEPDEILVCLPFPTGADVGHYRETLDWMRHGLDHERPLVNGYSGFFPPHFLELRGQLNWVQFVGETDADQEARLQHYPPEAALTLLQNSGIKLAVVREQGLPPTAFAALERFPKLYVDEAAGITIFELE